MANNAFPKSHSNISIFRPCLGMHCPGVGVPGNSSRLSSRRCIRENTQAQSLWKRRQNNGTGEVFWFSFNRGPANLTEESEAVITLYRCLELKQRIQDIMLQLRLLVSRLELGWGSSLQLMHSLSFPEWRGQLSACPWQCFLQLREKKVHSSGWPGQCLMTSSTWIIKYLSIYWVLLKSRRNPYLIMFIYIYFNV